MGFITGKTEVATGCAKHGNVLAEVITEKTEVATGCAKHGNVLAEVITGKTEVATGCAKHGNVKAFWNIHSSIVALSVFAFSCTIEIFQP
ncbi:hypothetical protein LC612_24405 [Nostoc sp. CHAB 5834]|nr:hypothetical protein [Nostoc sp. CHAB 5834]